MSKKFKSVVDISKSLFNQVQNETVHNFRFGTALTKKRILGINLIRDNYYEDIKAYDKTGLYLLKDMQIKQAKTIHMKETGRGGPKKGEGKKSKVRARK
jgi:hypothetical protein